MGCHQFHPRPDGLALTVSLAASASFICLELGKLVLSIATFEPVPLEGFSMRAATNKEGCLSQ
jgi:hypothetical protein